MPLVIAASALFVPPLAILLCGKRVQAGLSLALFVATLVSVYLLRAAGAPDPAGSSWWYWSQVGTIPGLANIVWAFVVARDTRLSGRQMCI